MKREIYIDRAALAEHKPSIVVEEDGIVLGRYTEVRGPGFAIKTHKAGGDRPAGQQGTKPKVWIETEEPLALTP